MKAALISRLAEVIEPRFELHPRGMIGCDGISKAPIRGQAAKLSALCEGVGGDGGGPG